jgi:hypothetical protein
VNLKKHQVTITEEFVYNVLRLKGIADCVKRSNVGGWQSERCNRKSFPWAEATVDEVKSKIKFDGELTYWYNINTGENYNEWHDHDRGEEDALCGVLYLQTPPNCGAIEFKTKHKREIIYPYPGLLIVFPDDLMHRVLPNEGDGDRVSMAFNFWRMLK